MSYFKGFSVFNSLNAVESAEIIYSFVNKFLRTRDKVGYYSNNISITNNEDLEKNEEFKRR